jgi:acetyl-CoA carboxylase carboxyltransferase component
MGTAGVEFVFKKELQEIRGTVKQRLQAGEAEADVLAWQAEQEGALKDRYEEELMNPNEGLSLGSISQIVMPSDLREVLCKQMDFHLGHYTPEPFNGPQREFH